MFHPSFSSVWFGKFLNKKVSFEKICISRIYIAVPNGMQQHNIQVIIQILFVQCDRCSQVREGKPALMGKSVSIQHLLQGVCTSRSSESFLPAL